MRGARRHRGTYPNSQKDPHIDAINVNSQYLHRDRAWGACGAGRAALGYNCIIDNVTHAPQASNGISWRYTGEGLICLCPSHHLKAETKKERKEEEKKTKKEEKDDFFFPPNFSQGATLLISLGNMEHSLTLAMPRKQAVMRSRPMAKPP